MYGKEGCYNCCESLVYKKKMLEHDTIRDDKPKTYQLNLFRIRCVCLYQDEKVINYQSRKKPRSS